MLFFVNAANIITLIRIALVPVFMLCFMADSPLLSYAALLLFIVASATDGVDGYVARKYNQVTNFGKFIDPLADKLLITSAILIFVSVGRISPWAAMIILSREFAVTSLRVVAISEGIVIQALWSGKIKTVVQIASIIIMMTPFAHIVLIKGFMTINDLAVWIMVAVTVWSGIDYIVRNRKVLSRSVGKK